MKYNLYNADCLDILRNMPDESVDCVVTDCPYRIVSGGCTNDAVKIGRSTKRKEHEGWKVGDTQHINLGGISDEFNEWCYTKDGKLFEYNEIKFSEWLPELFRVLKVGTHCYIMVNARNLKDLWQDAENEGFVFQQLIVWDKGNSLPNKYYLNSYELILMLRKGNARNINELGTKNILYVPNIMRNKLHPTEKPVDLMKILIENSTDQGQVVLDPFMGVGSTGVACKELERDFIGIEIDEKYFNIAKQRIENGVEKRDIEENQMTLFDMMEG